MSEDEKKKEQELFQALAEDPEIAEAVTHYNQACDSQDEEDGCPICTALKALEILQITAETYKPVAFMKQVQHPPYILATMQKLIIWFAEAGADFLEFIDENTDYDDDHDHEEDEEEN